MKINIIKLILIILIISFVSIGATSTIYFYSHRPELIAVNMDLTVEDSGIMGMNADNDSLHFGSIPRGGTSIRKMNLANNKNYPLLFNITIEGNFKEWVHVSNNNFILQPKENKEMEFITKVPDDAPFNIYNGTVYITLRRY